MKETKTGDVVGRSSGRSLFLGDPGAIFFSGKLETGTKKENGGLWKLTPLWKSAHNADSHSGLESTKRFPQFPQGPTTVLQKGLDSPAGWGQIK
jgi:hypothetical protein